MSVYAAVKSGKLNYDAYHKFLKSDTCQYSSKYVAFVDGTLMDSGDDYRELFNHLSKRYECHQIHIFTVEPPTNIAPGNFLL